LGSNNKFNNYEIAVKFPGLEGEIILEEIVCQISKSGG